MKKTQSGSSQNGQRKTGKKGGTQNSSDALHKLFEDSLKDIYWAEKALTKAIPQMMKKAESEELIAALEEHLAVTENQITRLEEVFNIIGKKPQAKKCDAMEGLIKEAKEIMSENEGMVRDAGIIGAAQKVEHYEIASYGTMCAFANTLGLEEAANLLKETLEEEKETDMKLSEIAESTVNIEALQEEEV